MGNQTHVELMHVTGEEAFWSYANAKSSMVRGGHWQNLVNALIKAAAGNVEFGRAI